MREDGGVRGVGYLCCFRDCFAEYLDLDVTEVCVQGDGHDEGRVASL